MTNIISEGHFRMMIADDEDYDNEYIQMNNNRIVVMDIVAAAVIIVVSSHYYDFIAVFLMMNRSPS